MASVTALAIETNMAIMTLLAIETNMAIVTVLAINIDIYGYRDRLGHQNQHSWLSWPPWLTKPTFMAIVTVLYIKTNIKCKELVPK